jgi:hypothetical protein
VLGGGQLGGLLGKIILSAAAQNLTALSTRFIFKFQILDMYIVRNQCPSCIFVAMSTFPYW